VGCGIGGIIGIEGIIVRYRITVAIVGHGRGDLAFTLVTYQA